MVRWLSLTRDSEVAFDASVACVLDPRIMAWLASPEDAHDGGIDALTREFGGGDDGGGGGAAATATEVWAAAATAAAARRRRGDGDGGVTHHKEQYGIRNCGAA